MTNMDMQMCCGIINILVRAITFRICQIIFGVIYIAIWMGITFILQDKCNYCGYRGIYSFAPDDSLMKKQLITVGVALVWAIVTVIAAIISCLFGLLVERGWIRLRSLFIMREPLELPL